VDTKDDEVCTCSKKIKAIGSVLVEIEKTLEQQYGVKVVAAGDIEFNPPTIRVRLMFDQDRLL